jgi:hypothetical protein
MYYLYCEDLASALVGPFNTKEEAVDHVKWMWVDQNSSSSVTLIDKGSYGIFAKKALMCLKPEVDRQLNKK